MGPLGYTAQAGFRRMADTLFLHVARAQIDIIFISSRWSVAMLKDLRLAGQDNGDDVWLEWWVYE